MILLYLWLAVKPWVVVPHIMLVTMYFNFTMHTSGAGLVIIDDCAGQGVLTLLVVSGHCGQHIQFQFIFAHSFIYIRIKL